jgi:hypothetical protein
VHLHEFGDHAVFAMQLGFQGLDLQLASVLDATPLPAAGRERTMPVLKKLLLPEVELIDLQIMPVTDFRDGRLVKQMLAQDADLLLRSEMPTGISHETILRWGVELTPRGEKSSSY